MNRQNLRIRIDDYGRLEIVDPGLDAIELLQAVDPDFRVQQKRLLGFTSPRFLTLRSIGCGVSVAQLADQSTGVLWATHAAVLERLMLKRQGQSLNDGEISLLDLKTELARRSLSKCELCAQRCGVDRLNGELGVCRLGPSSIVAECYVHIAEEPIINPSLVLNLAGCGLRCRFCQQFALLDPGGVHGEELRGELWSKLDMQGARSLSFIGGNPDESLYAILRFLCSAPDNWNLPLVWNSHGCGSLQTVELLDGVVDVFVPDFKYGNDDCGRRLSSVSDYMETAKVSIGTMVAQGVPVIVRVLVLPEHFDCCHGPVLGFLATLKDHENLSVSIRGQYCPDWRISEQDGALARRPNAQEVDRVNQFAFDLGLRLVE